MTRYLMTHSLLSSWLYAMKDSPYEDATTEKENPLDEFLTVLHRQPTETTRAMQNGIEFENLVTKIVQGLENEVKVLESTAGQQRLMDARPLSESDWYDAAKQVSEIIKGGQLQYRARKVIQIGRMPIVLYGRLDALKAGVVYDIKFSSKYERGKYFNSTQHPTYLELIPEASEFTYLVSNGYDVWGETYRRDETPSIIPVIYDFFDWLKAYDLMRIYQSRWAAL